MTRKETYDYNCKVWDFYHEQMSFTDETYNEFLEAERRIKTILVESSQSKDYHKASNAHKL